MEWDKLEFLCIKVLKMKFEFTDENARLTCSYTDDNQRIFNMSVPLDRYNSKEEAQRDVLEMAVAASKSYEEVIK
nr:MAG TPA: hypothetical protein [Caudoviricetes sp.]